MVKKRFVALMMLFVFVIQMSVVSPMFTTTVSAANQSKMLKADGNKLVWESDPSVVVRLCGVNVCGAEWTGTPGAEKLLRNAREAMERWNANLIRLPVSVAGWYGDKSKYSYVNDGGAGYRSYIKSIVTMISDAGKYVVLDLHQYKQFEDTRYKKFWQEVASSSDYKNNPAVLFGILNEPHGTTWEVWRNGNGTNPGHQQIVEAIRDKGAKNIIIAGGLDWAFDLSGIVGKASGDSKIYALTDQGSNNDLSKKGNGIMYDTHIYPWKGGKSNWDNKVGLVRKQYPILLGETGFDYDDTVQIQYAPNAKDNIWIPELFAWMNDSATYGNLANWTGWCFHPSSSPRILGDKANYGSSNYSFTPTSYWGAYVKDELKADLGKNLLIGKTVTASDNESGYPMSNALDSDYSTYWKSSVYGDKHITVDLGSEKEFNRWIVRNASSVSFYDSEGTVTPSNTRTYKLQYSSDGSTWKDADSLTENLVGVTDRYIKTITARYVRLYITKPASTGATAIIHEFAVYSPTSIATVDSPTADRLSGNYDEGVKVAISVPSGSTVRYTIDGTEPNINSSIYTEPFVLTDDVTIKAIAFKGDLVSDISTYTYKVRKLESISVLGAKTVYAQGELFLYSKGYLKVKYSDSTSTNLPLTNSEVIISSFDPTVINMHQLITVKYRTKETEFYIIINDNTFHGDYELQRNMNTETPAVNSTWNGVSASYKAGEAEDGEGNALKITGGTADGGFQLECDAENFGTGTVSFANGYDINGFVGASYMALRVKSTNSFNVRLRIENKTTSPSTFKNSKQFFVPSTGGEWGTVYIPFKNLESGSDSSWLYNLKGTADKAPAVYIRIENANFAKSDEYAVIGKIRMMWFVTDPAPYNLSLNDGFGNVTVVSTAPYTRVVLPTPQNDNGVFVGWYKDEALSIPWISSVDQLDASKTLYAKWRTAEQGIICEISDVESALSFNANKITGSVKVYIYSYDVATNADVWVAIYNKTTKALTGLYRKDALIAAGDNTVIFDNIDTAANPLAEYTAKAFVFYSSNHDQPMAVFKDFDAIKSK